MIRLLAVAMLMFAATAKADCPGGVCPLKNQPVRTVAKAAIVAPVKVVQAVMPSKCCHHGITPTASVHARPGFFGHHRWMVAKRVQRGGFIARIRFSPGR